MTVDVVQLYDEADKVRWKIGSSGNFRVKDMYLQLCAEGSFLINFCGRL
jgi:hypothetical protein